MKFTLKILLTSFVALLLHFQVSAAHNIGYEFVYECMNACTMRVRLSGFQDCGSATGISSTVTWTGLTPGCTPPSAISPQTLESLVEITQICPTAQSSCNVPASFYGVLQYTWAQDFDICTGTPCIYDLNWSVCCRNPSITALSNPSSHSIQSQNNWVNTTLATCNNSPKYTSVPFFKVCEGEDLQVDQGAFDPDGDSLVYSLGTCYNTPNVPVAYAAGYSATSPLGPTWAVSIDSETGLMQITANPGALVSAILCVVIDEYRNGILIGKYQRDVPIWVFTCPNINVNPSIGALQNLGNCQVVGDDVYVCNSGPICFDVPSFDQDLGQVLTMYWRGNLPGASFSQLGNPAVTDTLVGSSANPPTAHFCWTPTTMGDFYLRIRVYDDFCPFYGYQDRVLKIHVGTGGGPLQATANVNLGQCPEASFSGSACSISPLTYQWSGSGGLSGNTASITHSYPGAGIYPWQLIVSDGNSADTLRDTVVIGNSPSPMSLLTGAYFVAPCVGILYDTLDGPNGYAGYLWSNGITTQNQIVALGGNYGLTVTANNGCSYADSTTVFWSEPDMYGFVETSTGQPLQNQKIALLALDTATNTLDVLDSMWTDSSGYYFFCNVVDSNVYLKALPLRFYYSNELPSYADLTSFWNDAALFQPPLQSVHRHDFTTNFGTNLTGTGFLGGVITEGINKMAGVGDPVPNVTIFLRNRSTGAILDYRKTDLDGYFSFANIPFADYEFAVDVPFVDHLLVPDLTLDAQNPSYDSLDFRLHSTYLELVLPSVANQPKTEGFHFDAVPNPFGNRTRLILELQEEQDAKLEVVDAFGKRVAMVHFGSLPKGKSFFEFGEGFAAGIYFVRLEMNGELKTLKILKTK